jgi:hypothetical protein
VNSYATAVLGNGESIVYRAVVSPWAYARAYCVCSVLLTVGGSILIHQPQGAILGFGALSAGAGVIVGLSAFINHRTTELVLTDRCLIAKWGLLSRKTVEMALSRIESFHVAQSVLGPSAELRRRDRRGSRRFPRAPARHQEPARAPSQDWRVRPSARLVTNAYVQCSAASHWGIAFARLRAASKASNRGFISLNQSGGTSATTNIEK